MNQYSYAPPPINDRLPPSRTELKRRYARSLHWPDLVREHGIAERHDSPWAFVFEQELERRVQRNQRLIVGISEVWQ